LTIRRSIDFACVIAWWKMPENHPLRRTNPENEGSAHSLLYHETIVSNDC
jgi:hypothetical protein